MADEQAPPSSAEPTYSAPIAELPASPAGPQQGEAPPDADSDFIMSTLFGQDAPVKAPVQAKPAGDQEPGAKPEGGETKGAPPTSPPAATEPEAVPQEQPPVPGASPSQPVKEQPPAQAAPKTPAPGQQPAAAEPPSAESRLTPEERLQLASIEGLRQQNQQLLDALRGQTAPQGQPGGGGAQPPVSQPSGGPPIEQVHLTVPDELYGAVFAEDERQSRHGLNVLVSSIATAAVNHVLQKVQPIVDQRIASYDNVNQSRNTAQAQEQDYYGAYPAHKNPVFRTVIEAEMGKMATEMPNAPWNEDFRNALGTRVNRTLQLLGFDVGMVPGARPNGAGQEAPPAAGFGAQPQGGSPPAPAPMLDSSARSAAPASASDFIAATFS
jgi:hypothetical protein